MIDRRSQGLQRMLGDIRNEVALTSQLTGKATLDPRVMSAMARVPRDAFVPQALRHAAYDDRPLPIGHGQTISQPYMVALMTDLVEPEPGHRILEIGTGSGYQTAVLSLLCDQVYSIDRVAALSSAAIRRLEALGYINIASRVGNGYRGWPDEAPFDGIVVTAAAATVPGDLVDQLSLKGKMAIPVGEAHGSQDLVLIEKDENGRVHQHGILPVAFVPMIDSNNG